MSLNKSEQSLHIEPRTSRQLAILLLLMHGLAMVVIANLAAPIWLTLGLAGSVVVLLISAWNIYIVGNAKRSVKVMVWDADGNWTLVMGDKQSLKEVSLMPSSFIFPKMLVLKFLSKKNIKYSTVVMPDSLNPRLFRKLVLRLRLDTSS